MANNNLALTQVYNHYINTYAPRDFNKNSAHKKSELRSVYNSIVKLNKESPLYIVNNAKAARDFAVGVKENAVELKDTISSLGGMDKNGLLNRKAAFSSNRDLVEATYIGDQDENGNVPSFEIEVKSLATNQINTGNTLPNNKVALEPGTYSFDVGINDLNYEFQYNINEGETNKEVQERLGRLINNADIGLSAEVTQNANGTALVLKSQAEGLPANKNLVFTISDNQTSKASGSVEYFGLDYVSTAPSNASFSINGNDRTASSNHFTVEKIYELELKGVSSVEGETSTIGLKADVDSMADNIKSLIGGYNSFMKSINDFSSMQSSGKRLVDELQKIAGVYQEDLSKIGVDINSEGELEVSEDELKGSLVAEDGEKALGTVKDFANSLLRKTNQISLNPMNYVDKTIVAYKNPGRNFATPYITSAYTGMLFNFYC